MPSTVHRHHDHGRAPHFAEGFGELSPESRVFVCGLWHGFVVVLLCMYIS